MDKSYDVMLLSNTLPPLLDGCVRLYLCRHGETDFNREHKLQGRGINTNLNSVGRMQAKLLAKSTFDIQFAGIYSSSLTRARETASIVAELHAEAATEAFTALDEMSFGTFEGKSYENFEAFDVMRNVWQEGNVKAKCPGGECPADVAKRGIEKVVELVQKLNSQEHIMIISHGRFNKILLSECLYGSVQHMGSFPQENACVNVLDFDIASKKFSEVAINCVHHIQSNVESAQCK